MNSNILKLILGAINVGKNLYQLGIFVKIKAHYFIVHSVSKGGILVRINDEL